MPKRNKLPSVPDYKGIGNNSEKMLVQKSNPLMSLSETSMTLPELKILDAYLARIDSHSPSKRCVQFEKGELEKLLNYTRMHRDELEKRIDNLFQTITIQDETKPRGFTKIALFVKAECFQDDDGLWKVNLACSEEAMEYIFNVENLGYLKYRLRNVINFTSRYSYFLYLYLEDNIRKRKWEVDLEELKQILDCKAKRYNDEFKFFRAEILNKAQKDIIKNTDVSFDYLTIKKGRKVVAIQFEVERKPKIETTVEPTTKSIEPSKHETTATVVPQEQGEAFKLVPQQESKNFLDIPLKNLLYLCNNEFSENQISEICQLVNEINIPSNPLGEMVAILNFIVDMYKKMDEYAKINGIDSTNRRFAYLKTMLQNYKTECQ